MILVDSSVWIDYLRGTATPQTDKLDALLGVKPLAIGDLIMTEVLRGCPSEREFTTVRKTIDTMIATRCIVDGLELLHSDHDFEPFERHLGLRCVVCET